MKTKRTTRASFSADSSTVNVQLPTSWSELTQEELRGVYRLITLQGSADAPEVPLLLFAYFTRMKVLRRDHDRFECSLQVAMDSKHTRRIKLTISPGQLAELLDPLDFITSPGSVPVRLEQWGKVRAVNAQLHGLSFGDYLRLENLYQGFLSSRAPEALNAMAGILYPGIREKDINEVLVYGLLQWFVQVKTMFAGQWNEFFRPASGEVTTTSMLEAMNNEIRALTGGDVTKEEEIFAIDCWRALTELNFKAREAREYNAQLKKSQH